MKTLAYYEANVGNEHSKSANAAQAETEGRWPMTVAAKKLGISAPAFRAGCSAAKYEVTEWHHTGSHARRTDYYDTTVLVTNADFWRGAATKYSDKAAAKLLEKHGICPLSDEELAAATEKARDEALANVRSFLADYGEKYVLVYAGDGLEDDGRKNQRFHPNSSMDRLGLFTGYDGDNNRAAMKTKEEAEAKAAEWLAAAEGKRRFYRVVKVRDDILNECALYGRVAGKFTRVGDAKDFIK